MVGHLDLFQQSVDQEWFTQPEFFHDEWEIMDAQLEVCEDEGENPFLTSLAFQTPKPAEALRAKAFASGASSGGFKPGAFTPAFKPGAFAPVVNPGSSVDSISIFGGQVSVPLDLDVSDGCPAFGRDDAQGKPLPHVVYTPHVPTVVQSTITHSKLSGRDVHSDVAATYLALAARFMEGSSPIADAFRKLRFPAFIADMVMELGDSKVGSGFECRGRSNFVFSMLELLRRFILFPSDDVATATDGWWTPIRHDDDRWRLLAAKLASTQSSRDGYHVEPDEVLACLEGRQTARGLAEMPPTLSPRLRPAVQNLALLSMEEVTQGDLFMGSHAEWLRSLGLSTMRWLHTSSYPRAAEFALSYALRSYSPPAEGGLCVNPSPSISEDKPKGSFGSMVPFRSVVSGGTFYVQDCASRRSSARSVHGSSVTPQMSVSTLRSCSCSWTGYAPVVLRLKRRNGSWWRQR
jgi:hypothetical protein